MDATLHPLGPALLSEVDEVVGRLRGSSPRRSEINELARRVSVRLAWRDLGDALLGLTLAGGTMLLHQHRLAAHETRANYVFAHELAHVLCHRGEFPSVGRDDEEWFADCFARELVLPRRWLYGRRPAELAIDLNVGYDVVALQLAAIGHAPPLMRYHQTVLCRTCGTRAHRWDCDCLGWRTATAHGRRRLPDARQLDLAASAGSAAPTADLVASDPLPRRRANGLTTPRQARRESADQLEIGLYAGPSG